MSSRLFRLTPRAAFALALTLLFISRDLMAQTAPAPSGGGLFPDFNAAATKAFKTAERVAKGASNTAKVVDGFITTKGEEDEERERKAQKKMQERMEELSPLKEYADLKRQQEMGTLTWKQKPRLIFLEAGISASWEAEQIAQWETRNGQAWTGGEWPVKFTDVAKVAGGADGLIPLAGLQEYFTQILMEPTP